MYAVLINNTFYISIIIDKNFRLSIVHNYEKEKCYTIIVENSHLTAKSNWFQKMFKTNVELLIILNVAKDFNEFIEISIIVINKSLFFAKDYYLSSLTLT